MVNREVRDGKEVRKEEKNGEEDREGSSVIVHSELEASRAGSESPKPDSPFSVCSTSSSVSPTPSIILVFVIISGLATLTCLSTSKLWRYLALGSRTNGVLDSTVSML